MHIHPCAGRREGTRLWFCLQACSFSPSFSLSVYLSLPYSFSSLTSFSKDRKPSGEEEPYLVPRWESKKERERGSASWRVSFYRRWKMMEVCSPAAWVWLLLFWKNNTTTMWLHTFLCKDLFVTDLFIHTLIFRKSFTVVRRAAWGIWSKYGEQNLWCWNTSWIKCQSHSTTHTYTHTPLGLIQCHQSTDVYVFVKLEESGSLTWAQDQTWDPGAAYQHAALSYVLQNILFRNFSETREET